MNKSRQYLRNLSLYARGIRWLWSRRWSVDERPDVSVYRFHDDYPPPYADPTVWGIEYKPGWSPLKFLPVYLTTYLLGTLAGYGVVSLSRAWYERRETSRLAHYMTRLLNWLLPGKHGMYTGPRLWGSVSVRE